MAGRRAKPARPPGASVSGAFAARAKEAQREQLLPCRPGGGNIAPS